MESISFIYLASWGQSIAAILAIVCALWVAINWPKWTYGTKKPDGTYRTESEMQDEYYKRAAKPGVIGTPLIIMFLIMIFIYIFNKIFGN